MSEKSTRLKHDECVEMKKSTMNEVPNELALKMDGAEAGHLYSTTSASVWQLVSRRA